jgi:hypothetical protein
MNKLLKCPHCDENYKVILVDGILICKRCGSRTEEKYLELRPLPLRPKRKYSNRVMLERLFSPFHIFFVCLIFCNIAFWYWILSLAFPDIKEIFVKRKIIIEYIFSDGILTTIFVFVCFVLIMVIMGFISNFINPRDNSGTRINGPLIAKIIARIFMH